MCDSEAVPFQVELLMDRAGEGSGSGAAVSCLGRGRQWSLLLVMLYVSSCSAPSCRKPEVRVTPSSPAWCYQARQEDGDVGFPELPFLGGIFRAFFLENVCAAGQPIVLTSLSLLNARTSDENWVRSAGSCAQVCAHFVGCSLHGCRCVL